MSAPSDSPQPLRGTQPPGTIDRRVNKTDRRALTIRTLLRSGFSPRRRGGRRAEDHEQPIDFHEPRLLIPAAAMLLLSVADAILTLTLISDGAEETNPLLALVLTEHPRLFAAVKMALTSLGTVLLVALARARVFRLVRVGLVLYGLAAAYLALVAYEGWLVSLMP